MNGSCRVKASAALQEGWSSSFLSPLRISGYNSATVGRRSLFFVLAEFFGCPRTNCPLEALLPRSNQYSMRSGNCSRPALLPTPSYAWRHASLAL